MLIIVLMPEQKDVYCLFYKIMFYLFSKMMFYNMSLIIMAGHYTNYALGNINACSRVRFQPII